MPWTYTLRAKSSSRAALQGAAMQSGQLDRFHALLKLRIQEVMPARFQKLARPHRRNLLHALTSGGSSYWVLQRMSTCSGLRLLVFRRAAPRVLRHGPSICTPPFMLSSHVLAGDAIPTIGVIHQATKAKVPAAEECDHVALPLLRISAGVERPIGRNDRKPFSFVTCQPAKHAVVATPAGYVLPPALLANAEINGGPVELDAIPPHCLYAC